MINMCIQFFYFVKNQIVNWVVGSKCQVVEYVVIQFGKGIGVIGYFISGSQYFLCFIGMLMKCGVNKNSGNIGMY